MNKEEVVLLRIQLDADATKKEMEGLTKDILSNKDALQALKAARKTLSDDDFAKQTVALTTTIKAQQREYAALAKDLELYNGAVEGTGTSYKNMQSALSLAQRQFQQLEGSATNNNEATQALSATIEAYRAQLTKTDADQGAHFRQIGKYPKLSAEAQASLESLAIELEKLRQQQAETAKGGGPVSEEAVKRIQELESELANAKVANTQYGKSVGDLEQKLKDLTSARYFSQDTEQVESLNRAILETKTQLGQATGVLDEFGERTKKNAQKEDIDTLADAFGGVTAAIQLSTLAALDQEDADVATAKATQILAQAEALRNLQIGIASAKDAGHIVFLKAKNFLFAEAAVATTTATAATTGQTTATVAQTAATGGATVAQQLLNLAMRANPIGFVVLAIGALVGGLVAFSNASDATKKRVADITEKVLRFGTPVGQAVTLVQYLYTKFQLVRDILDPVGRKLDSLTAKLQPIREFFGAIADKAAEAGRSVGEYVGLLETAVEKAAKASAAAVEQSEKEIKSAQLRSRELELAGAKIEKVRATEREALAKNLEALKLDNANQSVLHLDELQRIDSKIKAGTNLIKEERKAADERREREDKLKEAQIALADFDLATADKVEARNKAAAAARAKEISEAKTNAEKAKKLAEQELKDQYTARKQLLDNRQQQIARVLEVVEKGSADEQRLLREQAANATAIQLADNSATQVGVLKKQESALLEARKEIAANGRAAQRKLDEQFATEQINRAFELALKGNETRQAQAREGSNEELRLKQEAIALQLDQDIQAIDKQEGLKDKQAEKDRLRAVAARATAKLEYDNSLQNLADYFADKEVALEQDYAAGRVSEKQYQDSLTALQKARVEAGKVLNRDYQKDTADLNREGEKLDAQLTAHYKEQIDKRIEAGQAFGKEVGEIFAAMLTEQGASLEAFAGEVLILVLDLLERQLQAQVAASIGTAVAGSLSSPQSVATAGVAGFAQAALLTAAISAAFGVAKALIRQSVAAPTSAKFERGGVAPQGVVKGPSHAQGGVQMWHQSGAHIGEMEGGEIILTKGVYRDPFLFAAASRLNVLAGGIDLRAGVRKLPVLPQIPRHALGGVTPTIMRMGLAGTQYSSGAGAAVSVPTAREVGQEVGTSVAAALRRNPPINRWADFKSAEARNNFTDSLSND